MTKQVLVNPNLLSIEESDSRILFLRSGVRTITWHNPIAKPNYFVILILIMYMQCRYRCGSPCLWEVCNVHIFVTWATLQPYNSIISILIWLNLRFNLNNFSMYHYFGRLGIGLYRPLISHFYIFWNLLKFLLWFSCNNSSWDSL